MSETLPMFGQGAGAGGCQLNLNPDLIYARQDQSKLFPLWSTQVYMDTCSQTEFVVQGRMRDDNR